MQSPDPGQNYFELFGLKPVFDIDATELRASQQRLQATYHPDRHVSASAADRRASVQMASWINQAFETLRDPVKRSRYLLEINGAELPDESATTGDAEFLMEQLELREAVEGCREDDRPLNCCARIAARLEKRAEELAGEFVAGLEAGRLDEAVENSRKMQFIQRIQHQLSELQFELEDA
jgi:molecular chaperone HscB